jgi:hypothetical protein
MLLIARTLVVGASLAAFALVGVMFNSARAKSPPYPSSGVTFRDFNGAVYLSSPEIDKQLGIGWTRQDFSWSSIEPDKGKWSWDKMDQLVQGAHAQSVEVLPVLDYTAPWAASIPGQQFSAPRHVEDWEDYVEHVVARYSQPPFNLRYFQIWNEPTRDAGFWRGTDQEFIDLIYLPAASIVRRHHCYVVFGGWGMGDGLPRFNGLLAYRDAWKLTDIVDVHYYGNAAWQPLYDRWVRTGQCRGIWQTEVGFVADPDYLPGLYLWSLYWALRSGWNDPNQYKVFWYDMGATGPTGARCLTTRDSGGKTVLTENGRRLAVLNGELGGGTLALFTQFTTTPALAPGAVESRPMALGFRVGAGRVVIALLLDRATCQRYPAIRVRATLGAEPQRIELVTVSGERKTLPGEYASGHVDVVIPSELAGRDGGGSKSIFAYLELDQH